MTPDPEWLAIARYRYRTDPEFHAVVHVMAQEQLARWHRQGPQLATLQESVYVDSQRRWADMDIESEVLALGEEACEALSGLFRAVVKRRHGTRGSEDEWSQQLRREVAQTANVLLNIASIEGFDLFDAMLSEHERWRHTDTNHDPIGGS